jgi:hypothetical protein
MVDGIPYVDSRVLFDQPLKPAIDTAAKDNAAPLLVLHVIYWIPPHAMCAPML